MRWFFLIASCLSANYIYTKEESLADLSLYSKKKIIDETTLYLNGSATHRRFIFNIYKVSLFVSKPTQNPDEIIYSSDIKYAKMLFLRNIAGVDIRNAFLESYKDNCLDVCERSSKDMERLLYLIPDMKENDFIEFIFRSNSTTIQGFSNQSVNFASNDLGLVFLRSWIGENPPSNKFKNMLLGL